MEEELENLLEQFALIDLMTRKVNTGLLEILVKKIEPLEFRMEPDHHGTPHIHINYGRQKRIASYGINDGVRLAGNLENKYDKVVKDWISKNQPILKQIWISLRTGDQKAYELKIGQLL